MNTAAILSKNLNDSIELKKELLTNPKIAKDLERISSEIIEAYHGGRKVFFCGNGGSAADAQHLAAELTGRYYFDRPPLFSEALHVNTSYMTAVANDYSYEHVYERMVEASMKPGDILIALSTSGNSENIVRAVNQAKKQGVFTVGMTGESGGKLFESCDLTFRIPSKNTPRIQEAHMILGHTLCEIIEYRIFHNFKENQNYLADISEKLDRSWTLFLDRDGVLNQKLENDYVKSVDEFKWIPGALDAVVSFGKLFGRIVIVTNQQGIGKGLMTQEDLHKVHQKLEDDVLAKGGTIDAFYFAKELADKNHPNRKPNIGMGLKALEDFPEINFSKSLMVGDSISDIEFAQNLGMHSVFLSKKDHPKVDFRLDSLKELADILGNDL
ncbi:MAG: HAD-IIIA family hydrolase [Flavobacteriales bacterium]|jgi:D-sedoheptulose 7-phosphate isomerase|nr:HAD-IIIA family hydrolase [Flavobacteriales bacterium]